MNFSKTFIVAFLLGIVCSKSYEYFSFNKAVAKVPSSGCQYVRTGTMDIAKMKEDDKHLVFDYSESTQKLISDGWRVVTSFGAHENAGNLVWEKCI